MRVSSRPPGWALAADLLAVVLVVAGTLVLLSSDLSFRLAGIRVSVRSPWRLFLWAVFVLAVRNWYVRRPPSFNWLLTPFKPSTWARLRREANAPLVMDERALLDLDADTVGRGLGRLTVLTIGFSALTVALLWPQVRQLGSVSDLGDPLFSIWRLAWVNHQLLRDPLSLFDANQFHPERLTLTYSDAMIVPALMAAPLFWMGIHPVMIYNVLLLASFALSGVSMFLLARALTGRVDTALIAGTLFALYPYRFEHYSHFELLMTMWMPLALWGLHRTLASGRVRDGVWTGVAFALQTLSSLYYGCFLAVYMTVLGGALWLGRGRPRQPLKALAAGALLAALLIAPVAWQYIASRPMTGPRDTGTIQFYSAVGRDYLQPNHRSSLYRRWSEGGSPERELFPRLMPVALSAVAFWPPLSTARIAYTLAFAIAVDGSFGFNGLTFTSLHALLPPFQGLRVPARFSLFAGLSLSVLSAFGAMRLLERWPRRQAMLAAAMLALVIGEALPVLPLQRVWDGPPPIYGSIAGREPPALLAEFPMPPNVYRSDFDARYLYFSTFHWQHLVNGNSGFFPPSYFELLANENDFPNEAALQYLRSRHVEYLTLHGRFTNQARYDESIEWLDGRSDLELVSAAPWEGGESRLEIYKPSSICNLQSAICNLQSAIETYLCTSSSTSPATGSATHPETSRSSTESPARAQVPTSR
jgi:hypothetical protein